MSEQQAIPAQSIAVNGEAHAIAPGCSVDALLVQLGLQGKRVAVALNREVIPRSGYAETLVAGGDQVEILEAVGGG